MTSSRAPSEGTRLPSAPHGLLEADHRPSRGQGGVTLQGSEGMHGPCATVLNNGHPAEALLEQETGAFSRASRAQEMPRNVGLPRTRRAKGRRPSMSHAGWKSRICPQRCLNVKGDGGAVCETLWPFLSALNVTRMYLAWTRAGSVLHSHFSC